MLRIVLILMACALNLTMAYAQVKVGDNPLVIDDASLIEIESTSKGFLPSRMTTAQRDLQPSWELGHIIYNLTDSCLQIYSGSVWGCFLNGAALIDSTIYSYDGQLSSDRTLNLNGMDFYISPAADSGLFVQSDGNVGIGTISPDARLDIDNGTLRLSDYGSGAETGISSGYVLGVETDGDVIEIDVSTLGSDDQKIDSLFIRNDSLLLSIEDDGEDFQKVDLSAYKQDLELNGDTLSLTNDASTVDLSPYAIDSSIYKYDGTLPEDRTLTLGMYDLTFSGTNDVTFESSGELGIGESMPDGPLHVTESTGTIASASDGTIIVEHSDSGGTSSLVFKSAVDSGSDFGYIEFEDDGSGNGSNSENSLLTIGVGNDSTGTAGQDDIAILPSGNVGIGTTAPDELLHVAGNMRLDGALEDKDGDPGSSGQVLTSTNTGTDWVDASTVGTDNQVIDSFGLVGTSLHLEIEDDINGLDSVDLSPLRGGSVDLHDDVDVTTVTPDAGDVLAWDGVNFVPQETDNGYTIFNVWAEESAAVNGTTEWSFGNGDETPLGHGILIPVDCELWAMSLDHENGVNTTVRALKNSDASLSTYQVTTTAAEQGYNVFGTPLTFSAGDVINFQTISASAAGTSGRVSAWFRIRATPASNSLLEDLMDVSAMTISTGQVLVYNGASFVPGDISDDQNLSDGGKTGNNQTINIEDGSSVTFSVTDADSSVTNEIQTIDSLGLTGTTLSISLENDGEVPVTVDLGALQENIYNADGSLDAARTVTLNANNLTFDGTGAGDVIIESDGDIGIGTTSPAARLDVDGGSVRFSDYGTGTYEDTTAVYMLGVEADGDLIEMNTAKNSRWFYPPAIIIDASDTISNATIDLHQEYVDQFSVPAVVSSGAPGVIPYYDSNELYYYVSFYDNTILSSLSIDASGVLTYTIDTVPADNYTVINVVFVIKEP